MNQKQELNFNTPVILLGNGAVDEFSLIKTMSNWPIVCADGGTRHCISLGRKPDVIIGDMDSFADDEKLYEGCPTIKMNDQNTTDLEKCLTIVNAPLVLAFGCLWPRFDHGLASLTAFYSTAAGENLLLIGGEDVILKGQAQIEIDMSKLPASRRRVSVWPMGAQAFNRSEGLQYSLNGVKLVTTRQSGVSNFCHGENFLIEAGEGDGYLIILDIAALPILIEKRCI